ncbi:hypothetical protein [Micromonospora aurantiaca]|uniref:Integral membrane protein n=1 Tax=Micromonospora aurantiaca (nom. illeg.) TaxID=47850 RepID=A0ABQ6UCG7_9ACTN|nr:hypothetical protein [Micromonospora aurantiaca]KAB1108226.1 hypothetical protein F6X54_23395 [Micromonospora aurantiaca]UFN95643.1 hypothetical protein LF814_05650 [Micromonospora aurantiaca]
MSATLPGPGVLTAWLAATVPAPLVFFEWTHRWEEDQPVWTALWWPVLASPVLAAVLAARQPRRPGVALGVSTLVATVLLALSLAFFRWVVPLTGEARWGRALLGGAALAVAGALTGYAAGGRLPHRARPASRRGYLIGGLAVVFGALLAQSAVGLGAEDSTIGQPPHEYGGVGPYSTSAGRFTAPAAGAYAIFAVGFSPADPDCRVTGGGAEVRTAEPVSVPPGDYGSDAATYSWVATVRVPMPGTWTLDCRTTDPEASYVVGDVPEIRGAVGEVIHWPVGVIWLLGAVPGLLIVADTARRRRAGPMVAVSGRMAA